MNNFPNIRPYRPGVVRKFSNSREYNLFKANYFHLLEFSSETYENGKRTNIKREVYNIIKSYIEEDVKIEDVVYITYYNDCGIPYVVVYARFKKYDSIGNDSNIIE